MPTAKVVTVNVAETLPAPTVTVVGTFAKVRSALDKLTTTPPGGAACVRLTVPVDVLPPTTAVGLSATVDKTGPGVVTVSGVDAFDPPYVAEIVTVVDVVTAVVETVNVAAVRPAFTVTLAGIAAAVGLLLVSETVAPPAGAGPLRLTVPVDEVPPTTEEGFIVTEAIVTPVPAA